MTFKQKILSSTKWVAFANIFKQVLQLLSIVVFARLLSPDDFGTFAILMIFIGFLSLFSDMGLSAALIHFKNPSIKLLSSVFYLNIFIGILLFTIFLLSSPYISEFFNNEQLKELIPIIAINFIIVSFGTVQRILYEKSLNFKNIVIIESIALLFGTLVGVGMAFWGLGIYSLIFQILVSSVIQILLIWNLSNWRPIKFFSIKEIKKIWSFSVYAFSFNIINYFSRNMDNLLIGKFLGGYSLGIYSIAYKIMLYPLQNITRILVRVLFPAFSQLQDDDKKFKQIYLRAIFFIALIAFPLMTGLMATADILVDVLFGEKWSGLDTIITILAPIGMIQSIVITNGTIFLAKGKAKKMFKLGAINSLITIVFFTFGVFYGIKGVALGYLFANIVMLYPNLYFAWRIIALQMIEGVKVLFPLFLISVLMATIVKIESIFLINYINIKFLLLLILITSGAIIYLVLIQLKYGKLKKLINEIKN